MSKRIENLEYIKNQGVVAVLRADQSDPLIQVAKAISRGGVGAIEITMTTPGAINIIEECKKQLGAECLLGAGTILDPETARTAILAGAEYIVTPTLNPEVIKLCRRYDKIVIPGAMPPTEILSAWEFGADIVKVFPATAVGAQFFRDVKGPLPQIELIPTGGINLDNAADFIRAGACAIAVGGNLADKTAIAAGDWQILTDLARQYVNVVQTARLDKPQ